jgi:glycosyltransferase involved in cell wall biosynthesis
VSGPRVATIGVSTDDPCGVRDHAALLSQALAADGVHCSLHWLSREAGTLGGARAELAAWASRLSDELQAERPDALLLHYSVFAFSYRGVPLLGGPVLSALRSQPAPLVCVLHEFAYPWRLGGARGKVWAATQRVALVALVRSSAGLVVTAASRAQWLRGRVWLARRPVLLAPVFSNLPAATDGATAGVSSRRAPTLGLFGYAHEGVGLETVLDALAALRTGGGEAELLLLGSPGRDSPAGERWLAAARMRGVAEHVGFSGRLAAQELADALAGCEALLFAERGGPTSRKTTLAASLASGRPVVALDGHSTWDELASARAALVVAPNPAALAEELARLLADAELRAEQGERGRAFAARMMSVEHSARIVERAIADALGRGPADGR